MVTFSTRIKYGNNKMRFENFIKKTFKGLNQIYYERYSDKSELGKPCAWMDYWIFIKGDNLKLKNEIKKYLKIKNHTKNSTRKRKRTEINNLNDRNFILPIITKVMSLDRNESEFKKKGYAKKRIRRFRTQESLEEQKEQISKRMNEQINNSTIEYFVDENGNTIPYC